jgi:hypothetical protein
MSKRAVCTCEYPDAASPSDIVQTICPGHGWPTAIDDIAKSANGAHADILDCIVIPRLASIS